MKVTLLNSTQALSFTHMVHECHICGKLFLSPIFKDGSAHSLLHLHMRKEHDKVISFACHVNCVYKDQDS